MLANLDAGETTDKKMNFLLIEFFFSEKLRKKIGK